MHSNSYVIGVDFGTDSVRAVIVDALNGNELSSSVFTYALWKEGLYCNVAAHQFRQHPLDYIEGLENSIKTCLQQVDPIVRMHIKAISIDTTGSTPVAVNESGLPLSLLPAFAEEPDAMFILWKDHTSIEESNEINLHAKKFPVNYLKYVGGVYSSEWFWAKLLNILRSNESVRNSCYSWVEHCDWIPFLLTGKTNIREMKRSVCAAGHKALWSDEWDGLPPEDFFTSLDPLLKGFRERLFDCVFTSDKAAGNLSPEWAQKLGLSSNTLVGVGAFDAHVGAVGGQIKPYVLSKVMGTSTCDILVAPNNDVKNILINGICGQVPGSVIPGMTGMEAGQSSFGDAYAWFKDILMWPLKSIYPNLKMGVSDKNETVIKEVENQIISELSKQAEQIPLNNGNEYAIDWLNGRRTPDANQALTGAFSGLNLATNAPSLFRAMAEATCFGAKAIVDRFNNQGIQVKEVIGLGGVAQKSAFIMQMMADVLNMPIKIHKCEQTCAMGAAMFAATVAGIYNKVEDAMKAMGQGFSNEFIPDEKKSAIYNQRYAYYEKLGNFIVNNT